MTERLGAAGRATIGGCVALLLAACGGGGTSGGGGTIPTPPPGGALIYLTQITGGSSSTLTPNAILTLSVSAVLNQQNVQPVQLIQSVAMSNVPSIALDSAANIYVADQSAATIFQFPPNANGASVVPTRTLSSSALHAPYGIAIGGSNNVYVTDPLGGPSGAGAIDEFSATQSGNVAPIRQITGLGSQVNQPHGIAIDALGNIYVTNNIQTTSVLPSILEFNQTSSTPIRVINGSATGLNAPIGIAVDGAGNLYVANSGGNSITVYGPNQSGNAAPIRTIAGSGTEIGLPQGVALDSSGRLYVTNLQPPGTPGTLNVYGPGATGNVAPIALVVGSSVVVFSPIGIAL